MPDRPTNRFFVHPAYAKLIGYQRTVEKSGAPASGKLFGQPPNFFHAPPYHTQWPPYSAISCIPCAHCAGSPVFMVVAVLSLALGIGANTAIFTLINQLILQQLPVRNPEQLVMLAGRGRHYGGNNGMD